MIKQINIGPLVKVEYAEQTFFGQRNGNSLWMDNGTMLIPEGAVITEVKLYAPAAHTKQFFTDDPQTPYERHQQKKYGNHLKEDQQAESHDDLAQWHFF